MKKNTESRRPGVGGVIELSDYTAEKPKFTALLLSLGVNNRIPTALMADFPPCKTVKLQQVRSHMQLRVRVQPEKEWEECFGRYLDLSCVVYDNQAQEDDCRKAYQAF